MYINYDDYRLLGGKASFDDFEPTCFRACKLIDRLTHGRIHALPCVPDTVKRTVFEVINAMIHQRIQEREGSMTSFSNDGMAIAYQPLSAQDNEKLLCNIIVTCLQGEWAADGKTALLYAGVT